MKESDLLLNPNELVQFLKKPQEMFTKQDLIAFIQHKGIEFLNFRYVAEDGKLKTLNFVISSLDHLDQILTIGERVDGSSLFPFISSGSSDLYVIPRFNTAFLNPFTREPSLDILCSFYTGDGQPLASSPENILRKAYRRFGEDTGYTFMALGELEYYVNSPRADLFSSVDRTGYHQSMPFTKYEELRTEAMKLITAAGGRIKYGHCEVGSFSTEDEDYEQHEIEFLAQPVEYAADQLVIAKWIIRMLSYKYGVEVSFAPKITVGKAGSGLHIHMLLEKEGRNRMVDNDKLSSVARKMIAGILDLSGALTAFGNTIPTSYLRLVPHQEAPTYVCWGDRNRSVLVRVPLGWLGTGNMTMDANPASQSEYKTYPPRQSIEFRASDGSANIHNLLAGLIIATWHGLKMENGEKFADELYVDTDIFNEENRSKLEKLDHLPYSCWDSAEALEAKRSVFEKDGIFPKETIDMLIGKLKSYNDKDLSERLFGKNEEIHKLVQKYIHC
ncbi:MAG: glutamine synthetase [Bacteroidales bacterium]|nr:MAG: glutamine synthetase [Bacteroidales bacterium]